MSKRKQKVVSGIKNLSYDGNILYVTIHEYPTNLWFKNCPLDLFYVMEDKNNLLLWEWTYYPNNNKIYAFKYVDKGYMNV